MDELLEQLQLKYPLLSEHYDALECPLCEMLCYPDAKRANGTIVYNTHHCQTVYDLMGEDKSFEIDIDGDVVGMP